MKTKRILSLLLSVAMILSITTFVYADEPAAISVDTIKVANIVDKDGNVTELYTANSVNATEEAGIITVAVETTNLKKHTNSQDAEGYWTGFSVVAPEGASQMKYAFGNSADITVGELVPVEIAVTTIDEIAKDGVTFFTNAGSATPKTYAKLQWYNASNEAISTECTFVMDLSNVNLDYGIDYTFEPIEAKIVDSDDLSAVLYDDYEVTEEDGIVSITMTELKEHTNNDSSEGYWTGFSLVAPTEATQMRYAFSTSADADLGALTPVENDIDEAGNNGVAFYVNAADANPKKYVKIQWYGVDDLALSDVVTYEINLDNVTFDWIKTDVVKAANIVDKAAEPVETLYTANSVVATADGDTITVDVTTTDLKKHSNDSTEGYWTGFSVVAPEGANGMKVAFDTTEASVDTAFSSTSVAPLETAVFGEDDGVAFFTNAGAATPKKFAKLQWFAGDVAVSAPTTFVMDLSNVNLDYGVDYTFEPIEAKIVDSDDISAVLYDDYEVTEEDGIVSITMTELKEHTNNDSSEGYWTGFSLVAPTEATQMRYAFSTSADADLGALTPVENDIDEAGNNGVAFYVNAADANPKKYVKIQWYGVDDLALSDVVTYEINLDNVTFDWIKTDVVKAANIVDKAAEPVETLYTANSVVATADGDTITVDVTTTDLKKHSNDSTEGYWTGFSVVAPEGANGMKVAFDTTEESVDTAFSSASIEAIESDVFGEDDGVAFFTNAGIANSKVYAKLRWYDESNNPVSATTNFVIDISNVTLDGLSYIAADDVVATKVVDQANTVVQPYGSYNVTATADENNVVYVDIDMTDLKQHSNGSTNGYWTGFAVIAPADATHMKYGFATDMASLSLGSATAIESEVATVAGEEKNGIAFYSDITSNPKKYAILQWFDDGMAISNPTIFEIDLTGVAKYQAPTYRPTGGSGSVSNNFTVTFNTNGGSEIDSIKVKKNEVVSEPTAPTKDGFKFDGWYTDKGLTTEYDFASEVTKSFTLYAKWVEVKATDIAKTPFIDVKDTDWFSGAVEFVYEKGIAKGVSDTEYAPQGKVTRAQFITMLCRAYEIEEMTGDNFVDCGDTWYTGYLAAAKQLGISNGIGDNKFAPEKEITREEMVALIYNYLKATGKVTEETAELTFIDSDTVSEWAKAAVTYAAKNGIVNGKDNNMFDPQGTATRAELAQIFYNMFK